MAADPISGEPTLFGEQTPQAAGEQLLDLAADEGHPRVAPGLQPHLAAGGGIGQDVVAGHLDRCYGYIGPIAADGSVGGFTERVEMLYPGDGEGRRNHGSGNRRKVLGADDVGERDVGSAGIGGEVRDLGSGAVLPLEVDEVAPIVDTGEVPVHHRCRHGDIDVVDHASGHGVTVPVSSAVPVNPSGGEALFGFEKVD